MLNDRSNGDYWQSDLLSNQPQLIHAVTKRGFNMAVTVGADRIETPTRRELLCTNLKLPFGRLTMAEQVHGKRVAVVAGARIGCGRAESATRLTGVDAMVTNEPGVPLMVLSADCALLCVFDPAHRAVGVAHAGWRSTAAGIVSELIRHMIALYESAPADLLALVSPCAGACCYEVREDVVSTFAAAGHDVESIVQLRDERMYLDLVKANALQLSKSGVSIDRIDLADVCTICSEEYYSHRRGPGEGHFGLIAAIR
jgi:purine-nucleoside/S-methyl-5'-thioadenosine phosphorylase / adenosine deaminase